MAPHKTSDEQQNGEQIVVSVQECPPTQYRPQAVDTDLYIDKPSIARANRAVSTEKPQGSVSYSERYKDYSALQQHVLFFDRDGDGMISPWDTYIGFRDLGFNVIFSFLAMLVINLNFSYPTRLAHSYIPDPMFRVYVHGIHKVKHGSDTGTYDPEGRFLPQAFENMFSKYAKTEKGALTLGELFGLMHGQKCAGDLYGWAATFLEWGTTWLLLQKDGKVYKEDVRRLYDGSIFWEIKSKRENGVGWNQGYGFGGDGFFGAEKIDKVKL